MAHIGEEDDDLEEADENSVAYEKVPVALAPFECPTLGSGRSAGELRKNYAAAARLQKSYADEAEGIELAPAA